jgi:hypothetical protein
VNTDYIYWTFTAAAQCVSTFVALLLTGYALVLSQIEAARDRDESLQELHDGLRKSYHTRLTVLAWLTATSVILSLLAVWVNRSNEAAPAPLLISAAVLDMVAMVAGLAFVVTIIDPAKYRKAAERELEQVQAADPSGKVIPAIDYFRAFRKLERATRELAQRHEAVEPEGDGRKFGSLRKMSEDLRNQDVIPEDLCIELKELGKYRNLLYHGDGQEADFGMIERARGALARIRQVP